MFYRFIRCILLSTIVVAALSPVWSQNCPDTQPAITGADIACDQNASLTYTYSTPATLGSPTHSYLWEITPPGGWTIVGPTNQTQLQVKWQTVGTYTVKVTEWNNDPGFPGCVGVVATKTVNVQPLLHAYFYYEFDPAGGCYYNIVNFTGNVSVHADPNISYSWEFGDGTPPVSGAAMGVLTHTFPTTSGVTYAVTLTVTNSSGSTDQITDYVYINPDQYKPVANFTNSAAPVPNNCLYNPMSFDASTTLPKPVTNPENITILYYEWDFGDPGSGSSNQLNSGTNPLVTHIFSTPGPHTITLTVTNSKYCTNTYTKNIVIDNTIPAASFTNSLACIGEATEFSNTSTTPIGNITQLDWIFGDGTSYSSTNPSELVTHTYGELGTYTAKLRVTNSNNCISEYFIKSVSVNPSPMASFLVGNACFGEQVQFTNTSTLNGGSQIANYLWDFGDPSSGSNTATDPNPTHLFSATGTFSVSLHVTNVDGCANTYTFPVTVHPIPAVDFTFQNGTQTYEIVFHNITGTTVGNNLVWDYGDGTFGYGPDPSHVYPGPGIFNVILTATDATNGCSNTMQQQVVVASTGSAFFTSNSPKCVNEVMEFTPQIPGGDIVKEVWDFGDGVVQTFSTGPFPIFATHTYTSAGTFAVTRTVTYSTNFYESFSIQVVVYPIPTANFTYSNNASFPNSWACCNQAVYFTDLSYAGSGNIIQWFWNFDDPGSGVNNTSTLQNPSHVFSGCNTTYHVSLTVVDNVNNCSHTLVKDIFINPAVPVNFTFTDNTCLNQVVTFNADMTIMDPNSIATWDWDFGDGTAHSSNPQTASHLYAQAGTYNAILTVTDVNGCANSVTKTVHVMPQPIAAFIYASPTCDGQPVQFTDQSYIPTGFPGFINKWVWTWGDGNTTTVLSPASPNVTHTFPTGVYNFIVTLTVTSSFGCETTLTKPVSLIPSPTAAFEVVPGTPTCATQVVQFADLSQTNGGGALVSWLWNFGDPVSGSNNTSTSPSPSHTFASPGTYSVTLTVTNSNGCNHTLVAPVVINTLPVADFSATQACAGQTTQFTDNSTPNAASIVSYSWNFGDGGTSTLPSPLHTYSTYGTYNATLTIVNTNGCIHSVTKPVTVHPNPIAEFSFTAAGCIGSPVSYSDLSFIPSGFSGYINQWVWDFGDGTPPVTVTYPASPNVSHTFAGTAVSHVVRLTVTTTNGCTAYKEHQVNSIPSPIANFSFSNTTCIGQIVSFADLSQTNGGGSLQSWNWNFGDPLSGVNNTSTLQNPTHAFSGAGTFNVTLVVTSTNGCSNSYTGPITINVLPEANFSYTTACEGSPTQFTDLSLPNATTIISYAWNFGDGATSTQQSPQHTYSTYGIFNVSLTVTNSNGCIHSITQQVLVNPKPIAQFTFSPSSCVGSPVSFTNQSYVPTGYSSSINTWVWDFGDGSTPVTINFPANPNIVHTFQGTATVHNVKLTVTTTSGCTAFIIKTVTSVPAPIANFAYSSSNCVNQPVQFTDLSQTNGGGAIQVWNWDFGDPASGVNNTATNQNPTHSFSSASPPAFNVTLIVINGNGCRDTLVQSLTVNARPVADFIADTVCLETVTTFQDQSTSASGNIVSRLWDFGDGQSSSTNNPTHLYGTEGTFMVKLTVTTSLGCVKDTTKPVLVLGKPVANFSYSSPNCAGDSVQFSDLSSTPHGSIQEWEWDFGDGTPPVVVVFPVNPNVKHAFTNGGNYNVKLTITTSDGCSAEKISTVQIGFHPLANFSSATNGCALIPVQFNDLSQLNGGPAITVWSWDFDDPASGINNTSTTQNPLHAFTTGGTFDVKLIVTNANGCIDSITKPVTVNDAPVAAFSADTSCLASPTQFTDESTTSSGTVVSWDWNFGDPSSGANNTSTLQNPTHIYNTQGTYNVTLSVTNSNQCVKDTVMQIIVNPKPSAMFEYTPACVNDSTQFTDLSIAPGSQLQSWFWDFGDGSGTSTIQNPKYMYAAPGTYNVKLVVTNLANCTDSVTMAVIARPQPVAQFSYMNFYCPKGKVNFQDESTATAAAIATREWIFIPGSTSSSPNPTFVFPVTDATYAVTLIVTDTYGCSDTIVDSVYVKPGFKFTFTNTEVCEGYPTQFNPVNQTPGDSLYSVVWNFGDPNSGPSNTSLLYRPQHTFSAPGGYIVKLKAFNTDNCVDSVFRQIQVFAAPQPLFTWTTAPCDSSVHFTDSTQSAGTGTIASWKWIWGDGSDTTILAPGPGNKSHKYLNAGIYPVTLIITNTNGCIDSITNSVERLPCIKASYLVQDTLLCARYKIAFADSSLPATRINQWKWIWGDGLDTTYTSIANPVTHTYANPGTYNVELEIRALVNGATITERMISPVVIHPTPKTYFSNPAVCLNQVTLFSDTSNTFGEPNKWWHWNFSPGASDTSNVKNPVHRYDTAGTYDVKLIVMNKYGCKDSLTKSTRVYRLPIARYDNTAACAGDATFFTDISVPTDTTLWKWRWFFGDPVTEKDTSNLQDPNYKYTTTGDYSLRMIVKDYHGCIDTIDSTVTVNVTPLSAFTVVKGFNGKQGQIKLNNLSTGGEDYLWNFDNGRTSTDKDPVATYTEDGVYTISLITYNEFECSDTTLFEYKLLLKGLFVPNAFSPTNNNISVRLFQPVGINLKQYHVMVFDLWGHMLWESTKLDEKGRPVEGWDGTFEGNLMPQGNYMWKISATFVDDTVWTGSDIGQGDYKTMGTLTLIR
jgi:PKD repeat protein